MRAVLQRTSSAAVRCGDYHTSIGRGLLILLGVEEGDDSGDVDWLARKISRMRLFADDSGRMNLSVMDVRGALLVVSQFTLHASTSKGNRPSFLRAAAPDDAAIRVGQFAETLARESGLTVQQGVFGGDMQVSLVNDGPVTIVMDSRARE